MLASQLMSALDRRSVSERNAFIVGEARALDADALLALLAELAEGGPVERLTGVFMAQVTGNAGYLERMLMDPYPAVQAAALKGGKRVLSDAAVERAYADAPVWLRLAISAFVRTSGREALAARLIEQSGGDEEAIGLLPGCDSPTMLRNLPRLAYGITTGGWQRLGRRHPAAILEYAEDLPADEEGRLLWWDGPGWAVAAAFDNLPEQALALISRAMPEDGLPHAVIPILGQIAAFDPGSAMSIVRAPGRSRAVRTLAFTTALLRRLSSFGDEDLALLGKRMWPSPHAVGRLLGSLPPSRRATVFGLITEGLDMSQVTLHEAILDSLPHAERHRQARRMLAIARVDDDTRWRWRVAAHLPFDEAFERMEPEVRRPDADDRAAVYSCVISCAGRSRDPVTVGRALTWATRARNEQEPVRAALLGAVGGLPHGLFTGDHVASLDTLLTDAMNARDSGWRVQRALSDIAEIALREGAIRSIPSLVEWGLKAHSSVVGRSGGLGIWGLCDGLPRGREVEVYAAFRPHVEAAIQRRDHQLALDLADAFGKRGRSIPALQEALEAAALSDVDDHIVERAVRLWLEPPATRNERTERLIRRDVSAIRWDAVWSAVTARRIDLLDDVLAERFERAGTAWDVPRAAVRRWLPRQHERFAGLLRDVADDPERSMWDRVAAVESLGHLPGIGRAALQPFLDHEEVALQEAALGVLPWTDRPAETLDVLLAHAGGDRARVAMYAASRAARFLPPGRALDLLGPILTNEDTKITSRKEAARLIGALRPPGAGAFLRTAWPAAHRDVKAAIASVTSRRLLDDPEAWPLLEEAATGPHATAIVIATAVYHAVPERHRRRFGSLLVTACGHPEQDVSQPAFVGLASWARWIPDVPGICAAAVTDLDRTDGAWVSAVSSLVAHPRRGVLPPELAGTVRRLIALDADPLTPNGEAERDRPARRRLVHLIGQLIQRSHMEPDVMREALLRAAEPLPPDVLGERLALLVAAVRWDALDEDLREAVGLVDHRPVAAATLARLTGEHLQRTQARWNAAALAGPASDLALREDLSGGMLAVTLVAAAGRRLHWPREWRRTLVGLRAHPHPDVREAALSVTTA